MKFIKQSSELGVSIERLKEMNYLKSEWLTPEEIKTLNTIYQDRRIKKYLWSDDEDIKAQLEADEGLQNFIRIMNHKRFFIAEINGEKRFFGVPREEAPIHGLSFTTFILINMALSYYKNDLNKLEENYNALKKEINRQLLSKKFKLLYQFEFKGVTTVATPAFIGIDEVIVPIEAKKIFKIGDICLVKRDPVQNIFISCKVVGYSKHKVIRVNHRTIELLDGDFDGDLISVIQLDEKYIEEAKNIMPSKLEANFSELYSYDISEGTEAYINNLEELLDTKKNKKFLEMEDNKKEFIDSYFNTVLAMRTVKEGTAEAGTFCNWIAEASRNLTYEERITARAIGNKIQRIALDAKHSTGGNYKSAKWYKISQLRNKKFVTPEDIENIIEAKEEVENEASVDIDDILELLV